jgi:Na+/melibiose symporter-like transporter
MNGIETILVNYGLAGVVIYIFYRLISQDLAELRDEIKALRNDIENLITELRKMNNRECKQ